jgi:GH35 family endo-1,4-beta-xylanase
MLIQDVGRLGGPIDVLGLEAHMTNGDWPLERLWDHCETFGKHGKPLHWSELTVLSDDPNADHKQSWPSTPEGERRQAEYVEKLYTLLFSHPAVHGIMWWNFVDGDWDRIPGGQLRCDLTPKPAYDRLNKLVNDTWRTSLSLLTNANGEVRFRGFAGNYKITVVTDKGSASGALEVSRANPNRLSVRL